MLSAAAPIEASVLDLRIIEEEWVFGGWHAGEAQWCRAAFAHALSLDAPLTRPRM